MDSLRIPSNSAPLPFIWHISIDDVLQLEECYLRARSPVLGSDELAGRKTNYWIDNRCFETGQRFISGEANKQDWLFIHRSKHGNLGKLNYQNRVRVEAVWDDESRDAMFAAANEVDDATAILKLCDIEMIGPGTASWFRCAVTAGTCPVIDIHAAAALAGWRETPKDKEGINSFIAQMKWHADRLGVTVRSLDRAVFAAGSKFIPEGRRCAERISSRKASD